MLEAAGESNQLAAVVSEGAGTRMYSEQFEEFHGRQKVLNAPHAVMLSAGRALFSSTAPPPNLTDVAPKIAQPLFVIRAPNGGNTEHMSNEYYALAKGPKQIWEMGPPSTSAASTTSRPSTNAGRRLLRRRAARRLKMEAPPPAAEGTGLRVFGAGGGTRTHGLLITNQLLYQLSYSGQRGTS